MLWGSGQFLHPEGLPMRESSSGLVSGRFEEMALF